VAGLIWPDKLKPLFGLLMFPWPASYRAIRVHGFVAIGAYVVVLGKLLTVGH
jgi:NADH:ubiquinone oxidoreductase subunit 3 (subunit A)